MKQGRNADMYNKLRMRDNSSTVLFLILLLPGLFLVACAGNEAASQSPDLPPVVEIAATDYAFQAPDSHSFGLDSAEADK